MVKFYYQLEIQFKEHQKKQIISLGAGYDTFYFNLKASKKYNFDLIKYIEADLPSVVQNKVP
jgi:O-methyltransferase involved in polyketide biosynthesis